MGEALFSFRRIAKSLRRVADIFESGDVEATEIRIDFGIEIDEERLSKTGVEVRRHAGDQTITIKIHMSKHIKPETKELINKAMR